MAWVVAMFLSLGARAADLSSAPEFSVAGGVFTNDVVLKLSATEPGAAVHFTLDGSEPTTASARYAAPISLTNSTMVRARVFAPGKAPGAPAVQSFVLLDPDVMDFTSDLPVVVVSSFGREIEKDERIVASLRTMLPANGRTSLQAAADFDGRALINLRGRASLRYPKRSYTLKTVDARDDMAKFQVLGLPKESDWVLYAPYPDKTLMRDVLAYDLSNQIGRWAPRTRFVELFLNESGGRVSRRDYMGVYVFEEKVARGKNRVNIAGLGLDENSEPALTGGYIFKKDHGDGEVGPMQIGGPAFQSSTMSKTGFPTGPGGFPGDPAGFQPAFSGRSSSSSSSSSRSSRSTRDLVATNRLGYLTARQSASAARTVVRSGDDEEEYVEISEDEKYFDYFRSTRTNKFYYVDPEPDELTAVQRAWLKGYVNRCEAALYGPDFRDPGKGYAAFIDIDAFIDYHLLIEATKEAFIDRDRYLTDPDFHPIPLDHLLSAEHAAAQAARIRMDRAAGPLPPLDPKGDTVWFGVVDSDGNAVSLIQSIYHDFGSGIVPGGTGVILQNRGSFFSLSDTHVNRLEPRKRCFHTLNPAMLFKEGRPWLVYGTMGGEGQPQTQAAIATRIVDYGLTPAEAVAAPRWLHGRTWGAASNDTKVESRVPQSVRDELSRRGHPVRAVDDYTDVMGHAGAILIDAATGVLQGASDPRSDGLAAGY